MSRPGRATTRRCVTGGAGCVHPVQQAGIVGPHVAHRAADRPEAEHVVGSRAHKVRRGNIRVDEPGSPVRLQSPGKSSMAEGREMSSANTSILEGTTNGIILPQPLRRRSTQYSRLAILLMAGFELPDSCACATVPAKRAVTVPRMAL